MEIQEMRKYVCRLCNYIYNEASGDNKGGIPPGTKFEDLPSHWKCPVCGAEKDNFYLKYEFPPVGKGKKKDI